MRVWTPHQPTHNPHDHDADQQTEEGTKSSSTTRAHRLRLAGPGQLFSPVLERDDKGALHADLDEHILDLEPVAITTTRTLPDSTTSTP